ncbi:MAG: hypothetical protein WCE81_01795 [Halobacteriota archaeon]
MFDCATAACNAKYRLFKSDRKTWYQLPSEGDDAYRAFCLFLNMGRQRSLNKLAAMIDKWTINKWPLSVEQLGLWAHIFAWTKRVELCERFIHDELLMGSSHLPDDRTRQQETKLLTSTPQIGKKLWMDRLIEKRKAV